MTVTGDRRSHLGLKHRMVFFFREDKPLQFSSVVCIATYIKVSGHLIERLAADKFEMIYL